MKTFDHFAAEDAQRVFADMGRVGQVINFTHHYLAEIARRCARRRGAGAKLALRSCSLNGSEFEYKVADVGKSESGNEPDRE
jgi:hypothetical protein